MLRARYRRILWFFGPAILSFIGWDLLLPRLGFRRLSRQTRSRRMRALAVRFRILAVQMGGVMIKVGQFLSARLDVLPPEITDELVGLQDEVRPESFEAIRGVFEAEMHASLSEKFAEFNPVPLASASIGQVHQSRLYGEDQAVVVKIQRPAIEAIVETDLSALRVVTRWINYYPPIRKRANIPALLAEFSRSLAEEIDYLNEGSNAEKFAANFAGQEGICVPKVFWEYTTRRVLTLEEIRAIKITDYADLEAAGINRAEVAERLINTYLQQIFEDKFFHADPHPGNLFVLPAENSRDGGSGSGSSGSGSSGSGSAAWKLVFVDFGMTGKVASNQFTALREILIAVVTQDVPRLMKSYQLLGVLLPGADLDLLEKATQRVFERFWGKSTTEIVSLGQEEAMAFAAEFSDLLYEMPFQIPENIILLGRCLSILSGLCTGLNPDFNIWKSVMPYARRLIDADRDGSGKAGQGVIVQEALNFLRVMVSLPGRMNTVLQRIEQGRLEVQIPEVRAHLFLLERRINRLSGAIIFATFFFSSVQLYLAQHILLAVLTAAAAGITLLWILLGR